MNDIIFVSCANDEPMVSSRLVADKFGKEHKNVLRSLESQVLSMVSEQFSRLNFEPVEYVDAKGETRKEYLMTKDGFVMLAMGFTGHEAMRWKEEFLRAFNSALGSMAQLKNELQRKEAVILQLQGKKKRERRWMVPVYESQLEGFPREPKMMLKPTSEIRQPELNIAKLNHIQKTIEGMQRQMNEIRRQIGIL